LNSHRVAQLEDLWETVGMAKPTLKITKSTPQGIPVRGTCPLCGTDFSTEAFDDDSTYPHEPTLKKDFEAHFGRAHIREDASQAGARIVREATDET
jgi:hypothetical protein